MAASHPGGIVDLSVGTPVDEVPTVIRAALASEPAQAPGYPTTWGTAELREATVAAMARRFGVAGLNPMRCCPPSGPRSWWPGCLPCSGWALTTWWCCPSWPTPATRSARGWPAPSGCVRTRWSRWARARSDLVWINSPSNPTGRVAAARTPAQSGRLGAGAGRGGRLLTSATWRCRMSRRYPLLHPEVSGGSTDGLLAVHSLSKSSNMAGIPRRFHHRRLHRPGPSSRVLRTSSRLRDQPGGRR